MFNLKRIQLSQIYFIRASHIIIGPLLILYCVVTKGFASLDLIYILIGFFVFDSLGAQLGNHKLFSHQSFEASAFVETLLAYFAVMSGQGSPIFWAAIHQGLHHKHTDKELDPHSPNKGFFQSFLTWIWKIEDVPIKATPWLIKKPHIKFIARYHTLLFSGTWVIFFLLCSLGTFVSFFVIPCMLSLTLAGLTNYFLHRRKNDFFDYIFITYRSFEVENNAKNSLLLGPLSFGSAFHNNHHVYPDRSNVGIKWYEFDPSVLIIPLIGRRKVTRSI